MSENEHFCGPKIMPKFMRKWLSKKFNNICLIHDIHYTKSDGKRFEYDKIFLLGMVQESSKDREIVCAIFFYFSVRIFGRFFKSKEK